MDSSEHKRNSNFSVGKGTFIQYKKGLIEKDYTIGEVVGSGAFASVRKVKSKANGQYRALKIIKKQKNQNNARMYKRNLKLLLKCLIRMAMEQFQQMKLSLF